MNAEIISIGEELLIGQVINTNASWMAEQLNQAGISVTQITAIADNHEEILRLLNEAGRRCELILITGGLGPTRDDITKEVLCEFFDSRLVHSEQVIQDITGIFGRKGLELSESNRHQALVPDKATIIRNPNGTAPGLWFEKDDRIFVAMPGVPYEMQHMITHEVIPRILKVPGHRHIVQKTILTHGIGESFLSDIIASWETDLPHQMQLAYLPSPGMVRIRLTAKGDDLHQLQQLVEQEAAKLQKLIPQYIWGYDRDTMQEVTGKILKERKQTICTAESCTGGYIAYHITSVPGSSEWYKGSIVAYSNEIKEKLLNVDPELISKHGAVSQQVVEAMAAEALKIFNTDYAISVSGIAGPDGGTPQKPVGTVWIGIASKERVHSRKFQFGDSRERNILRSVLAALGMLRNILVEEHE
ncbi:MAG: competence/damage-inducible protein A [Bacteroidales bacterium]